MCTLVLPCQATECSDTESQCAHLASLLDSPSDPKNIKTQPLKYEIDFLLHLSSVSTLAECVLNVDPQPYTLRLEPMGWQWIS